MALKRFFSARFVVGLVFLANPVINLFDVLPDFVGWLLIFSALTEIAFLDERLETARRMTLYGAGISAVRLVLMFFYFDMDASWVLSCVSLFGAAELFAAIYFAVAFFGGITYMAQRCESENVLGGVDNAKQLWILFWIARVAATILPETAALPLLTIQHDPYVYPNLSERDILLYKNGATMVLFLIMLIFGIGWLIKASAFIKGIKKDLLFKNSLSARYEKFLEANPLQETFLACRTASVLLCAGYGLQLNLLMDGNAVLPAWAGTLLLAACAYYLGVRSKKSYILLGVGFGLQLVAAFVPLSYVSMPLLLAGCVLAIICAERLFYNNIKRLLDIDLEGGFLLARIPAGIFVVCRAVFAVWDVYPFRLAEIIAFGVWMFIIIRLCSSLMGEIKARRRL